MNLIALLLLAILILWLTRKYYLQEGQKRHPDISLSVSDSRESRKTLGVILANLQRWKNEGKITREEYDHLTDICLSEMEQLAGKESEE